MQAIRTSPIVRCGVLRSAGLALASIVGASIAAGQSTCPTVTVSTSFTGGPSNYHSAHPYLSPDARWLVFITGATDVVPGDANGPIWDVVLIDRSTGARSIAMRNALGVQPDGENYYPRISDDGRYVSCLSLATNLVSGDTNGSYDYFVRDLQTGLVERATLGASGSEPSYVFAASISGNGRVVAFTSDDPMLVPGDTNGLFDVFVRDLDAGTTVRVLGVGGVDPNDQTLYVGPMSFDGRYTSFGTGASNLIPSDPCPTEDVFLFDRTTGACEALSVNALGVTVGGTGEWLAMTPDARFVAFPGEDALVSGDVNGMWDVVVRDRLTGTNEVASVGNGGVPSDTHSVEPVLSADGRFVGFTSAASNLTANVPAGHNVIHLYRRDRLLGTTVTVDVGSQGKLATGGAGQPTWSGDGKTIVFGSGDVDLAPSAVPGFNSLFLRDCNAAGPVVYCTAKQNSAGCTPTLSFTGVPSASAGSGFEVRVDQVLNQKVGMLVYSLHGPRGVPFAGGLLCLAAPMLRGTVQPSGGSLPPAIDCSGSYVVDFNAFVASGVNPALQAGELVWCQQWSRDPGFAPPQDVGLSQALWFQLEP